VASAGGRAAWIGRVANSNGGGGSVLNGEMIQTRRGEAKVWNGDGG
jgi:hypothetical protein